MFKYLKIEYSMEGLLNLLPYNIHIIKCCSYSRQTVKSPAEVQGKYAGPPYKLITNENLGFAEEA